MRGEADAQRADPAEQQVAFGHHLQRGDRPDLPGRLHADHAECPKPRELRAKGTQYKQYTIPLLAIHNYR